jgi:hypothetical protein
MPIARSAAIVAAEEGHSARCLNNLMFDRAVNQECPSRRKSAYILVGQCNNNQMIGIGVPGK